MTLHRGKKERKNERNRIQNRGTHLYYHQYFFAAWRAVSSGSRYSRLDTTGLRYRRFVIACNRYIYV